MLFVVITTFHYFNEDLDKFKTAQIDSDSPFLTTDLGKTRYQIFGNKDDPIIVLIHSFNGFIESWNPNIQPLVNAGYQVVVYDLWGRGLSDRPRIDLSIQVFRQQLENIINHFEVEKVHLVGSSFGSIIAADFVQHHRQRIDKLILVGPAGWPSDESSSAMLKIPLLGDVVFHYFGQSILKSKVEEYFIQPIKYSSVIDQWVKFSDYPGFTRSALSTLRHSPVLNYTDGWKALGKLEIPILFIWGEKDVSFPYINAKKAKRYIPQAKVVSIEQAAHWVNVEKPEFTNTSIIKFLSGD